MSFTAIRIKIPNSDTFVNSWSNIMTEMKNINSVSSSSSYYYLLFWICLIIGILIYFHVGKFWYLNETLCNKMKALYGNTTSIKSLDENDPNCCHKLVDYHIKTASNACSAGSNKDSVVSLCTLKTILKQGVRSLDFELYSVDNKPVVATSTSDDFFTKTTINHVIFSDVMKTIKDYGFSSGTCPNSSDPLFIHLRIKSNNSKMYEKLLDIFKKYDDILLGKQHSYEGTYQDLSQQDINNPVKSSKTTIRRPLKDVNLLSLRKKVFVIVDNSNRSFLDNDKLLEYVNLTSNSQQMRLYNFDQLNAIQDVNETINYNKNQLSIVIPNNESNPVNPNLALSNSLGCQMVALRYQLKDENVDLSEQIFNNAGYAFQLKKTELRSNN